MESSLEKIQSIYNDELQVLRKELESKNKVINKLQEKIENISKKTVQTIPQMTQMIRTNMRENRSKYQKSIIQVTIRKTLRMK